MKNQVEQQWFSHNNEDMPERGFSVIASINHIVKNGLGGIQVDLNLNQIMTMKEAKELHRLLGQAIQYNEHRLNTVIRENS